MLPNYYIHEHLMAERQQELQREMAELRRGARLRRHRSHVGRWLAGKLGVLLVALGTSLQRLEPEREPAV